MLIFKIVSSPLSQKFCSILMSPEQRYPKNNSPLCIVYSYFEPLRTNRLLIYYSYILFLSRVVPGKGIEYLLDAYSKVQSDLKLIVAGGTEYVLDFRKMIEKINYFHSFIVLRCFFAFFMAIVYSYIMPELGHSS